MNHATLPATIIKAVGTVNLQRRISMAKRPGNQRGPMDFKPGNIVPWPADKPSPVQVSGRVTYIPSGEHKDYPSPDGRWTFDNRSDKAKCIRLPEDQWPFVLAALRKAIKADGVNQEFRGDFPSRVWAKVNGVLHEARLTNRQTGEYHAFPLEYPEQLPIDRYDLLRLAPVVTLTVV